MKYTTVRGVATTARSRTGSSATAWFTRSGCGKITSNLEKSTIALAFSEIDWRDDRQLGDLFVVAIPGEPYSELQVMIRKAVPEKQVIVSVNTNGSLTQGYILPAGICGCGVYQDKIAVVGPGGMEAIAGAASAQIAQWAYGADAAAQPSSPYSKM